MKWNAHSIRNHSLQKETWANWNGNLDDFDDDQKLDMALVAFKLTADDFLIGVDDRSARWNEITKLELVLPDADAGSVTGQSKPMTDYAFIGIDLGLVASSSSVVKAPEPSSSLLLGLSCFSFILRKSRRSKNQK